MFDGVLECAHPCWYGAVILEWYRDDMESYERHKVFSKPPPGWKSMLAARHTERPGVL